MSQNNSPESAPFTQEEVDSAELMEQPAYLLNQNHYLLRRVVALRAQNTRLQAEVNRFKVANEILRQDAESEVDTLEGMTKVVN